MMESFKNVAVAPYWNVKWTDITGISRQTIVAVAPYWNVKKCMLVDDIAKQQ